MPSWARILVHITRLELTISCWMWLVILKMWLFHSQLPHKICTGKNQPFLFLACPKGPSSVLWAHRGVPVLGSAGDNPRALVMTRTYLLASPRGCPVQQTQRKKSQLLPPASHSCPDTEQVTLSEGGWASSWALWWGDKHHCDCSAGQRNKRGDEAAVVSDSANDCFFFFTSAISHNPTLPLRPGLFLSFSDKRDNFCTLLVLIISSPTQTHTYTHGSFPSSLCSIFETITTSCRKTRTSFIKLCLCNWTPIWNGFLFSYKKLPFLFQTANLISSLIIRVRISLPASFKDIVGMGENTLPRWPLGFRAPLLRVVSE